MGGSPSKIRSNYDPVSVPSSPMISELEDEGSPFLDPQVTKPRINLRLSRCLDVAELSLPAVAICVARSQSSLELEPIPS